MIKLLIDKLLQFDKDCCKNTSFFLKKNKKNNFRFNKYFVPLRSQNFK